MFTFDIAKKEPRGSFFTVSPVGQLPLTNLLFPAETATRVGTNFACAARDHCSKFYLGSLYSKVVAPFGAIPLNQLQSLRDRNPRGITFGYATRDHCFVIASEGVIKKESRSSLFLLLPLD